MNYEERDPYGMYNVNPIGASGSGVRKGPGPELRGANRLIGNDVYSQKDEDLGDIKEVMLDVRSGRMIYAILSLRRKSIWNAWSEKFVSAPEFLVRLVVDRFRERDAKSVRTLEGVEAHVAFPFPKGLSKFQTAGSSRQRKA